MVRLPGTSSAPHMHQLGHSPRARFVHPDGSTTPLVDLPSWNPHQQPLLIDAPVIDIQPGDELRTTCTYSDPIDHVVMFGPRATDEMCYSYNLVYPISALPPRLAQAPLRLCDCTLRETVVTCDHGARRRIGAPAEVEGKNLEDARLQVGRSGAPCLNNARKPRLAGATTRAKEQIEMKSNATMATLLLVVGAVATATLACDRKGVHAPGDITGGDRPGPRHPASRPPHHEPARRKWPVRPTLRTGRASSQHPVRHHWIPAGGQRVGAGAHGWAAS